MGLYVFNHSHVTRLDRLTGILAQRQSNTLLDTVKNVLLPT